jgi:cupin 2 domain-containing protein
MRINNLFGDLSRHLPHELFTTQLDDANSRIERIVSHGHALPVGFLFDPCPTSEAC